MKKAIILVLITVILILLAQPVTAQYVYHEVTIYVEGEYSITAIGNGQIFKAEGTGKANIERIYISMPEEPKLKWWDLF